MAHECVEMGTVSLLSEVHLHRSPELLVESRLEFRLESHQNEVADEVGLTELAPRGVHAFENELRVVLISGEGNVDNHQLGQALAHRHEVVLAACDPFLEVSEVLHDSNGMLLRYLRAIDDSRE